MNSIKAYFQIINAGSISLVCSIVDKILLDSTALFRAHLVRIKTGAITPPSSKLFEGSSEIAFSRILEVLGNSNLIRQSSVLPAI